jgi:nitroreductase
VDAREVLYTTRAMRRLSPSPVPDDAIARIVDAGVRAPSPGTPQPWRFVVVTNRDVMHRIGDVWRAARDALLAQVPALYPNERQARSSQHLHDHFDEIPVLVLGYGPPALTAISVVPALWSMCLAARAEGLGSVFTTLLVGAQAQVDSILGVPEDAGVALAGAVPIGTPLGRWGVAPRLPAHEVSYADHWGTVPSWRAEPFSTT